MANGNLEISFEYRDAFSHGEWRRQSCLMPSVEDAVRVYGLDEDDVDYRILDVRDPAAGREEEER
jgi:hypothetical protein